MKNNDDARLLAHKQRIDAERRRKAEMRERAKRARAAQAMRVMADPSLRRGEIRYTDFGGDV